VSLWKRRGLIGGRPLPESPNTNPIENVWHELKEFLRMETKPRNKDELLRGIKFFGAQWTKPSV